ncbi:MAG: Na/Pi cotransporter family protein [Acholeplasmatales bacterium]|nr:Na/Pi cotransporter family protein [Acholeplasmatales bacterium]
MILGIEFTFDGVWQAVLYILCGLGIFLFGISMMGTNLKNIAGDKVKQIIERTTNTPFKGMIVGFLVTMLTQSASGTSALAVGLVASGLMSFEQSLGILLGANIGGTVLTIVLALFSQLEIMPILSVILVFVGSFAMFFFKQKKIRQLGSIVMGFGMIFLGLAFIDMSFAHILKENKETIENIFKGLDAAPELGVLVGVLFTMIVQSSSATIGIVQGMYLTGTMTLSGAIGIMLGANIGTTITAVIASLGSSRTAKKVAFSNVIIKVFGVVVFVIFYRWALFPLIKLINNAMFGTNTNPIIIALTHLVFNIINSFVFLLLLKPLIKISDKVFKQEERSIEESLLDYSLITKSSQLALSFAKSAIDHMATIVNKYIMVAKEYSFVRNDEDLEIGDEYEREINSLDKRIHDYLIKITVKGLNKNSSDLLSKYLDSIKDLERIGDHCTNILGFFRERYIHNMNLSEDGEQDLEQIFSVLINMSNLSLEAINNWNKNTASKALELEPEIDKLEEFFHSRHMHRVDNGKCSYMNSEHYVEVLSNIERMGDHFTNILELICNDEYCKYDEFDH